jgi:hypothetical protein
MWTAKRFRRQAATCAALAKQTRDEEGRQRYLRLEQTYLHLAEAEDQLVVQMSAFAASETKPAA